MKEIYLISYAVRGIKSLDDWSRLSFYKKTINKDFNIHGYNVKGIYGTNGVGKSAIVTSVKILREILINPAYLSDSLVQKKLDELINRKHRKLEFEVEYALVISKNIRVYRYNLIIEQEYPGRFVLKEEKLAFRNAASHSNTYSDIYHVTNGEVGFLEEELDSLRAQTKNLLSGASLTALTVEKIALLRKNNDSNKYIVIDLIMNYFFGYSLYAYLDVEDDHTNYVINHILDNSEENRDEELFRMISDHISLKKISMFELSSSTVEVSIDNYAAFETEIRKLERFLKIFKHDLKTITIDRKVDRNTYYCHLIMNYKDYNVDAEFESTGIKKLIKLFPYLQKMVKGEIVFIDEMDSNLHDVYLCALIEYLMEYGEGQLCFTTHNIGPMDVLKKNKKSIDFLSVNHNVYVWATNGNYSPSKLYRNGMIEGSPFNIDSIDFLGIFDEDEE